MSEKDLAPARHEPTDVGGRFIWIGAAAVPASAVLFALIALWLYPGATTDRTLHLPLPQYPNPQLQPVPRADMAKFYREEMQRLNSTGWVDKAHGIAHIPITEAMREIAQENIPGWPGAAEKPPTAQAVISAAPAPAEKPPATQAEVPASPATTEKPFEVALPKYPSARHARVRSCGARPGFQRPCLPAKARRHAPPARHVPRRHRAHGEAGRRL
ncbi:MAG: hypothetical protein ACREDD_02725 [Methylocella sp.]